MPFEFATAGRILFGAGSLNNLVDVLPKSAQRCIVVTGGGSVPIEALVQILDHARIQFETFRVDGEPSVSTIEIGLDQARALGPDFLIAFGGGSVIDAAKSIAALVTNPGHVMEYLEVIGGGKKINIPPIPVIAIPTTAGTGTEVTRNAVIASPEHHVKVSMRSPLMIPQVAIVDPELTITMPPGVTASTGMDALTQNLEAYVSRRANPMTDVVAREGLRRGAKSIMLAYQTGGNLAAREDMALCSLFGGLALANGGLGAVHGFAGPIGGMFDASHGAICASLLPYVMKFNVEALSQQQEGKEIKARYAEIAKILTGDPMADTKDGVAWLEQLAKQLRIPGLRSLGIHPSDFERIITKAKVSSSMQKNPIRLSDAALRAILEEAF